MLQVRVACSSIHLKWISSFGPVIVGSLRHIQCIPSISILHDIPLHYMCISFIRCIDRYVYIIFCVMCIYVAFVDTRTDVSGT